jgi:glycosyltransferase involved in cell wall biosynthesis
MVTSHPLTALSTQENRPTVKLSVAVVTYNHEFFIRQAIESALAQHVKFEYEIVVANDCSTDGTAAIVENLCREHPNRIVAVSQERNVGMMRNLCAALAACRGEYIALLEGDDYWTCPDKLQRQVDFLERHPDYAICCHRVHTTDEMGEGRNEIWPLHDAGSYLMQDLILENFIPNCSAVIYRSACIAAFPDWFFDFEFCDWPLHILVARSGKIELCDEVMSNYRLHPRSLYSFRQGASRKKILVPMFKALDRHLDLQYTDLISQAIASFYFDMAIIERLRGDRLSTSEYLQAAIGGGKLRTAGRWRALRALLAYTVFGYKPG